MEESVVKTLVEINDQEIYDSKSSKSDILPKAKLSNE
jgi:hypothetical protein